MLLPLLPLFGEPVVSTIRGVDANSCPDCVESSWEDRQAQHPKGFVVRSIEIAAVKFLRQRVRLSADVFRSGPFLSHDSAVGNHVLHVEVARSGACTHADLPETVPTCRWAKTGAVALGDSALAASAEGGMNVTAKLVGQSLECLASFGMGASALFGPHQRDQQADGDSHQHRADGNRY